MFCSLCPYQLQKDKSAIFAKITDMILLLDVAKHRTEEEDDRTRLDYVIEQLYELRMFADNVGTCQQTCSICRPESGENGLRTTRESALRVLWEMERSPDGGAEPAEKKRPHP
ncbi:hypothetical protein [Lyngbya sp. CCY1209]|jgi:hypothetical protein|uniref:hypothetical protein n=1 Tax=Lyngbya sp. CCY1209 TaxID=2886103 RepID=UPI002D208BB5|nr:hypothetical protein [Lyngbya sp. CCY1209]MEB3882832.1 hypothetical protein [Lyngbya sp. CCY1209]